VINRLWHGWTVPDNAEEYEKLLKEEIFPNIFNRSVKGLYGIRLLKRVLDKETEFITIMTFDSLQAVKEFAGKEFEKSYVPEKAKILLSRYDDYSQHYEVKEDLNI